MSRKMLIDAAHKEEIRVAILNGDRLDEYDFETSTKKQLKGNIYLAKVVRIEPSLQAAFVEFGGNRHGFLPFSEIHPDYYRIPIEDRDALLEATLQAETANDTENEEDSSGSDIAKTSQVEVLGGEDIEEVDGTPKRSRSLRHYKVQEVIKRRQIMLVQVVKEERGGKGAALTTYLSLAGRYCVLMPNALRGGGVSRKITNMKDRKRLKDIIEDLNLPQSMALIVRTAGIERTKAEIKRDSDYLVRLWEEIREKTLTSIAPQLIYEEGDIIKKALRDQYTRDIDQVIIEGEEGYKTAKALMKALMPSHVKKIVQHEENTVPLFIKYGIEPQIDAIYNPVVTLKSGGYLVFGTTEALVAIDVNSGKATRERHIEETAYKTNLEAAEEVARQLRLRDLAGLVVIDFIDMDDHRNNEGVERRLKDAMRVDRARVQVGRISPFGLLELSRQRLRPNILESASTLCVHCRGTGMVRSVESSALHLLRSLEEEAIARKTPEVNVFVPTAVALYVLNQKRSNLTEIEARLGMRVTLSCDDGLIPPDFRMEKLRSSSVVPAAVPVVKSEEPDFAEIEGETEDHQISSDERRPQRRQNRNRRQQNRREETRIQTPSEETTEVVVGEEAVPQVQQEEDGSRGRTRKSKYGRRRRGPRREGGQEKPPPEISGNVPQTDFTIRPAQPEKAVQEIKSHSVETSVSPVPRKSGTRKGWWQRLLDGTESD